MRILHALLLLSLLVLLAACSKETVKRGGYDAVRIYNCNEQINDPACGEHYPSYDDYQRERSKVSK